MDAKETGSAGTHVLLHSPSFPGADGRSVLPTSPGTVWPSGREDQVLSVGALRALGAGALGAGQSVLLTPLGGSLASAAPGNRVPQHKISGMGTRVP